MGFRVILDIRSLPDIGGTKLRGPGVGDVDIVGKLLAVVIEVLAQGDDVAANVCIFFDQIGNAIATIEDGGVISSA